MNVLKFSVQDKWKYDENIFGKIESIDTGDLEYHFLPGSIEFIVDDKNFSPTWGGTLIVDFAVCMMRVRDSLYKGESYTFDFSEGVEQIFFEIREKNTVRIHADYLSGEALIKLTDLCDLLNDFSLSVLSYLSDNYPKIFQNSDFLDWYPGSRQFRISS